MDPSKVWRVSVILMLACLAVGLGMLYGPQPALAGENIEVQIHLVVTRHGGRVGALNWKGEVAGGPGRFGSRQAPNRRQPPGGFEQDSGPRADAMGPGQVFWEERARKQAMAAAARLIRLMDQYGVGKAMIMPPPRTYANQLEGEIEILADAAKAHPGRLLLVGGGGELNPMLHNFPPQQVDEALKKEFAAKAAKLVDMGIKAFGEIAALHLSMNPHHVFEKCPPDHPLLLLLADLAAKYDLPIDLHMQLVAKDIPLPDYFRARPHRNPDHLEANLAGFKRLLSHNPKARIVWLHNGWDNIGHRDTKVLRSLLKAHPNLYLALRVERRARDFAGGPMPNRVVDASFRVRPEWLELFKAFPDRFVIGSDEFQPARNMRVPYSFAETWGILADLPPELAAKIGGANAKRIYRLK